MFYREGTSDCKVIEQIWRHKNYDLRQLQRAKDIIEWYKAILIQGKRPLIVDAGANIGASTLYFSEMYKQALILALEPERKNFDMLSLNTKQCWNVNNLNVALSSTDGEMDVIDPGEGAWGFRTRNCGCRNNSEINAVERVKSISMETLINSVNENVSPFIVKIDIEGGEDDLFSQNTGWVDKFPLLIIELHDWLLPGKANSANFLHCIADLKRDFVYVGEHIFSIKNANEPRDFG